MYEWSAGTFRKLDRMNGHINVVRNSPGTGVMLLYCDSKIGEFVAADISRMYLGKNKTLEKGETIPGLEGARFYTLAHHDLEGNGVPEWIGVGTDSRLTVWDPDGTRRWRGKTRIAGTNNAIRVKETEGQGDLAALIYFDGRVVVTDIDGDGHGDVLAVKNIPVSESFVEYLLFIKTTLVAYQPDGAGLTTAWTTQDLPYCISDMQVEGGTIFLAAEKPSVTKLEKGSGRILWFE